MKGKIFLRNADGNDQIIEMENYYAIDIQYGYLRLSLSIDNIGDIDLHTEQALEIYPKAANAIVLRQKTRG